MLEFWNKCAPAGQLETGLHLTGQSTGAKTSRCRRTMALCKA